MAQIDSNIYLQQQTPDIAGAFQSGMKMAALAQQGQEQQRQLKENQAVRDAFKGNVVTNPDGSTSLNRGGLLSDLAKVSPEKAMEYQQQFTQQDLSQQKAQHEKRLDQLDMIGRAAGSATDQQSYQQALQSLQQNGVDTSQMPQQYDANLVKSYQYSAMSAKDQVAASAKLVDQQLKAQENANKHQENSIRLQAVGGNKQGQAMQQTMSLLTSARGDPAVGQAEKDIYAAQKLNSLINMHGDPNKLNPQEAQLAASEVSKIATGGVPTSHELQGLSQSTIPKGLAEASQMLLNRPSPANQGAFLKEYQDYADSLSKDGQAVIKSKYGRIIESNKRRLNPDDYNALNQNFTNRFDNTQQGSQTVRMQAPDGSVKLVPKDQVDAATAAGGKAL